MINQEIICPICGRRIDRDMECVDFSGEEPEFCQIRVKLVRNSREVDLCPDCARKLLSQEIPDPEDFFPVCEDEETAW